jgi:tetratricopeptide (TPR) repeat protein
VAQSLAEAQTGNYSGCLDAARQAVKLAPGYAEARNNAGWCAANLGQWDEGIASLREAIRLQPDFIVAKNNLGWVESQRGAPKAPLSPADTALLESLREAQAQRYPACIDAARHAIELKANFPEAYNNLGYCTGVMGKLDEGVGYLHKALELRRDFPLASGNLTWMEAAKARLRSNGRH